MSFSPSRSMGGAYRLPGVYMRIMVSRVLAGSVRALTRPWAACRRGTAVSTSILNCAVIAQ